MDGVKADAIIADPPYGMGLDTDYSQMSGSPRAQVKTGGKHHTVVIGDDKPFNAAEVGGVDGIKEQFWFGADYYLPTLMNWDKGSWLVWDKRLDEDKAEMFGSHFELIWSKAKHKRRILRHLWAGVAHAPNDDRVFTHPTTKSGLLIQDIMNRWCGDLIYDPFGGSGTSLIAAEQTGRTAYLMEIDCLYIQVILERWMSFTGEQAVLETTGQTFEQVRRGADDGKV